MFLTMRFFIIYSFNEVPSLGAMIQVPVSQIVSFNRFPAVVSSFILKSTPENDCVENQTLQSNINLHEIETRRPKQSIQSAQIEHTVSLIHKFMYCLK